MPEGSSVEDDYLDLVRREPATALDRLSEFLDHPGVASDPALRPLLLRGAALAAWALDDVDGSNRLIDAAVASAEEAGATAALVRAKLTKAGNIFLVGDAEEGLSLLEELDPGDDPQLGALIALQTATALARLARTDEAVVAFDRAESQAERCGDLFVVAAARKNRGLLQAQSGRCEVARADIVAAMPVFEELGIDLEVAYCRHNLGLIATYDGDLPEAFAQFERAESAILALTGSDHESKASHTRALLMAGLFDEAAEVAADAADRCRDSGLGIDEADNRLLEAVARLGAGDRARAESAAAAAADLFDHQGRAGWGAVARLLQANIDHAAGRPVAVERVDELASTLARFELERERVLAGCLAAELAGLRVVEEGQRRLADLAEVIEASTADVRLAAFLARASIAVAAGRLEAAEAVAAEAYEFVADAQAVLGASDLRAGVGQYADRVGAIGLRAALDRGRPEGVLGWLERIAVAASVPRRVVPDQDGPYREALAALRAVGEDSVEQRRRLEDRVRSMARSVRVGRGGGPVELVGERGAAGLADALGERVGVVYGLLDGELLACVVATGRCEVRSLGSLAEVERLLRGLRSDLRARAARPGGSRTERILAAAARLDAGLIEPLGIEGPVVLAVPAALSAVPWVGLPSRVGRSTTVTSSLTSWAGAAPVTDGHDLIAAGPDLELGRAEVAAVAELRGHARRLEHSEADVAGVLAGLDGARVAHLVCHGRVRSDNPLLSSLVFADGPLHAYELESLDRAPGVMVLSACHVGLPSTSPGRQLLGLVTAMTTAGAGTVLASTLPVPDQRSTVELMVGFHRGLLAGSSPAEAWARLQEGADPERIVDSMAFTVFGRG